MRIIQNKSNMSISGRRDIELYSQAASKQKKLETMRTKHEQQKLAECTFSPKINQL